jgi:4-alpha-glucanotransferase
MVVVVNQTSNDDNKVPVQASSPHRSEPLSDYEKSIRKEERHPVSKTIIPIPAASITASITTTSALPPHPLPNYNKSNNGGDDSNCKMTTTTRILEKNHRPETGLKHLEERLGHLTCQDEIPLVESELLLEVVDVDEEEEEIEEEDQTSWPLATIIFKIPYATPYGCKVAMVGDMMEFGEWDQQRARVMDWHSYDEWQNFYHYSIPMDTTETRNHTIVSLNEHRGVDDDDKRRGLMKKKEDEKSISAKDRSLLRERHGHEIDARTESDRQMITTEKTSVTTSTMARINGHPSSLECSVNGIAATAYHILHYKYGIINDRNEWIRWEDGENRHLWLPKMVLDDLDSTDSTVRRKRRVPILLEVRDQWQEPLNSIDYMYERSAYRRVIFGREKSTRSRAMTVWDVMRQRPGKRIIQFQMRAMRVLPHCTVKLVGSVAALGSWNLDQAMTMSDESFPVWTATFALEPETEVFEYKYVIVPCSGQHGLSPSSSDGVIWESGPNRVFFVSRPHTIPDFEHVRQLACLRHGILQNDAHFRFPAPFTEMIRLAGIAVPVFSLRSEKSFGVGDFMDLKRFADVAHEMGCHLLQILPINDTCVTGTWWDSYPYSSLSVFALHPLYVNLEALQPSDRLLHKINMARRQFDTHKDNLNYEQVMKAKWEILHEVFDEQWLTTMKSPEFKRYLGIHGEKWLNEYAVFCALRDHFGTSRFLDWPPVYRDPTPDLIRQLITAATTDSIAATSSRSASSTVPKTSTSTEFHPYPGICFYQFVQFHLDRQMRDASEYIRSKHIILKGDLPIGVDPQSVDVWSNRHLFRLHKQTGAPPDFFSNDGQNWGFPTYDWEAMQRDNYAWWRARLACLELYFDAYRIDHVLGFFRIWEIPQEHIRGLMGTFHPVLGIHRHELERIGAWDFQRLCEPYIRRHLLEREFGSSWCDVAERFMRPIGIDAFAMRTEFSTETKLQAYFDSLQKELLVQNETDSIATENRLQQLQHQCRTLMNFATNVVLLHDDVLPDFFHFRILMFQTTSFAEIEPPDLRARLYSLYLHYFYERQEILWAANAHAKLKVMQEASSMLIFGEDLGMIPKCVQRVLDDLSIIGLRIQRMPKDDHREFDRPSSYPTNALCTPSCHDCSSLRGFWEENHDATQRYYNQILELPGGAPPYADPPIVKRILDQHLASPCIWCVFPLQDLFALCDGLRIPNPRDEQINIPANRHHEWKYRIPVTIEHLQQRQSAFIHEVYDLFSRHHRVPPI